MSSSLYAESVPVFVHYLNNLKRILQKAAAHAVQHRIDETALLGARLFPDMLALTRQVQIACDGAKGAAARLTGSEIPVHPDTEASFAELVARIDKTLAFIEGLGAGAFEGSGEREIVLTLRAGPRSFTAPDFLRLWALPNFYFHITTAYGLLRHNGVPLGKMDYLG